MKKTTILAVMMFGALGAYAQFNQGRMMVGGSAGFNASTEKYKSNGTSVTEGKSTSFSLAPQFGYFVIDNLAVGAGLDLSLYKWKDQFDNDDDYTQTSIALQPFVRYYLPQGFFFQAQAGVGTSKSKSGNNDNPKYGTSSFALSAGYALFLTDNVSVEPIVGFRIAGEKDKDSELKYIDSGIFLRVGFQIYLGNKE